MSYYDLAIIGNGYDLHYELPTKYENFYDMLYNYNILKFIPF